MRLFKDIANRDHVIRGEVWDMYHPDADMCPNMSEEHRASFVHLHDKKLSDWELLRLMGQDPGRRMGLEQAFRDDGFSWLVEIREVRVTSRKSIYDDGIYGLTREDVEAGATYPDLPENLYVDEKHPSVFGSRWEEADYWQASPWHGYTVTPTYEGPADVADSTFYPDRVVGSFIE